MRFFTGSYVHKVDAKGRVSLPVLFRRALNKHETELEYVVIVPQYTSDDYHVGFSQAGHEAAIAAIEGDASLDDEAAGEALDLLSAEAVPLQPDEAGRIVLPRELREALGIKGEVLFRGNGSHFQIWNPDRHDATKAERKARGRPRAQLRNLQR